MEFEPDPSGNNIDVVANLVIIDKVNRTSKWLEKQAMRVVFHKDCGCHDCRQRISDIADDNLDIANWLVNEPSSKWGKKIAVRKKK